jgi:hypothetical protein
LFHHSVLSVVAAAITGIVYLVRTLDILAENMLTSVLSPIDSDLLHSACHRAITQCRFPSTDSAFLQNRYGQPRCGLRSVVFDLRDLVLRLHWLSHRRISSNMGFRKRWRYPRLIPLEKGQRPNPGAYQRSTTFSRRECALGSDILGVVRCLQCFHWSGHDLPGCVIRISHPVLCLAEKSFGQGRAIFIGQVWHGDCK